MEALEPSECAGRWATLQAIRWETAWVTYPPPCASHTFWSGKFLSLRQANLSNSEILIRAGVFLRPGWAFIRKD